MGTKIPSAPPGTGAAGRRLWRSVVGEWELAEHEVSLLTRACRIADACADLQGIVDVEGVMTTNRLGEVKPHPALVELRQQSLVLARLIVALRVPIGEQEAAHDGRTQRRGIRGVYGVAG